MVHEEEDFVMIAHEKDVSVVIIDPTQPTDLGSLINENHIITPSEVERKRGRVELRIDIPPGGPDITLIPLIEDAVTPIHALPIAGSTHHVECPLHPKSPIKTPQHSKSTSFSYASRDSQEGIGVKLETLSINSEVYIEETGGEISIITSYTSMSPKPPGEQIPSTETMTGRILKHMLSFCVRNPLSREEEGCTYKCFIAATIIVGGVGILGYTISRAMK